MSYIISVLKTASFLQISVTKNIRPPPSFFFFLWSLKCWKITYTCSAVSLYHLPVTCIEHLYFYFFFVLCYFCILWVASNSWTDVTVPYFHWFLLSLCKQRRAVVNYFYLLPLHMQHFRRPLGSRSFLLEGLKCLFC